MFSGTLTQLFAAISGTLIAVSDGLNYGWTAPMTLYLISPESHISCTKQQVEFLEVLYMLGTLVSLPLTAYLVNKIGRKYSLVVACSINILGWIVVATTTQLIYMQITRLLFGTVGNMAFVVAPMYITEIADDKIRGFLSSFTYLMMLVGLVVIYSVGPYTPFVVTPIIAIVLIVIDLGILTFVPESPYYLILNNKFDKARESLQYFRPNRDIDEEFKDIVASVEKEKNEKTGFKDLVLAKNNLKAIIIISVLNFGQHMAAISVILMNIHIILGSAGTVYIDNSVAAIVFSIIMLVSSSLASIQVEKYGRKALLIASSLSTSVCLMVIAIFFNFQSNGSYVESFSWIPVVSIMIYAATFKFGLGIVPIVLTAEIFSPKMKAIGISFCEIVYAFSATVSLEIYTRLENSYGLHVPFYLFSVMSFAMAFFIKFYIPETKGRTLQEIQMLLKGRKYLQECKETEQENNLLTKNQVI